MSILEELVLKKKQVDVREVSRFAEDVGQLVQKLSGQLSELQQKVKEVEETNVEFNTFKAMMTSIENTHTLLRQRITKDMELQEKEERLLDYLLKRFEAE